MTSRVITTARLLIWFIPMAVGDVFAAMPTVAPTEVLVESNKVTLKFDFSSQPMDCGIEVIWGDGDERTVRVGRDVDERQFSLSHKYSQAPTGQTITIKRKAVFKGLGSVPPCIGANYSKTIQDAPSLGDASEKNSQESTGSESEIARSSVTNRFNVETTNFDINSVSSGVTLYQKVNNDWAFRLFCDNQTGNFNLKPHLITFFYKGGLYHKHQVKGGGYCPSLYGSSVAVTEKLERIPAEDRDLALKPFKVLFETESQYFAELLLSLTATKPTVEYLNQLQDFESNYTGYEALAIATGLTEYLDVKILKTIKRERTRVERQLVEDEFASVLRAGKEITLPTIKRLRELVVDGEARLRSVCLELITESNFKYVSRNCAPVFGESQSELVKKIFYLRDADEFSDMYAVFREMDQISEQIGATQLPFSMKFATAKQKITEPRMLDSVNVLKEKQYPFAILPLEPDISSSDSNETVTSRYISGYLSLPNPRYAQYLNAVNQANANYQSCLTRKAIEKGQTGRSFTMCIRPSVGGQPSATISQPQYSSYQYTITSTTVAKNFRFKAFASDGDQYRIADCDRSEYRTFFVISGMRQDDEEGFKTLDAPSDVLNFQNQTLSAPISDCLENVARSTEIFNGFAATATASVEPSDENGGAPANPLVGILNNSVVVITNSNGMGSGFFVTPQHIITNAHVVGDNQVITIRNRKGVSGSGLVIAKDDNTDLAIIVSGIQGMPAELSTEVIQQGEDVYALGHPVGLEFSLSKGVVSAIRNEEHILGSFQVIQTDAAISPGNSGGPLGLKTGGVVGINVYKRIDENSEGLAFAITSPEIVKFLKKNNISHP